MPLYTKDGSLLKVSGALATSSACCCGCLPCSCLPSTVTISYPSWQPYIYDDCSSCGGTNNGRFTVPAGSVTAYLCCVDNDYALYRANAIFLGTTNECCSSTCIARNVWLTVAVGATCTGTTFSGWSVALIAVLENYNTLSCTPCVTSLTARSISSSPCAGVTSTYDVGDPASFFTCTNTCYPASCIFWQLEYAAYTAIISSDPCNPTGSGTATIPGFEDIGTVTVS